MRKRRAVLSLGIALALVISLVSVAYAADFDLYNRETKAELDLFEWLWDADTAVDVGFNPSNYLIEANEEWYEFEQVNNKFTIDPDIALEDAITDLEPVDFEEPADELEVVSVSAINNKEINVVFNNELNKASAETASNYVLSNAGLGAVTPKLQADKKTVILTVATAATQQATTDVTVKDVKDVNGKVVATTKKSVTFFDTLPPVAEKVEVVGPKALKVTFSEPLKAVPTFILNGGAYSVTVSGFAAGAKEVNLTLGAVLPAGTHELQVSGGEDYANGAAGTGFAVNKVALSFTYASDTTAPTVSVEKATELVVTLKFSKPVKAVNINTDVTVYHTVNNAAGYKGTLAAVNPDANSYSDTYTATFVAPIPAGEGKTVFLNTKENKFEDQWGNDVVSTTLTFNLVSDATAPSVVKAEATGKATTAQKEVTLTFDEEVVKADAENKVNYVLKDALGNIVKTADFADVDSTGKFNVNVTLAYDNAKKQVKISFTNVLKAGDYKLEVSNIKDTSFAGNKMGTQTVNLTVEDKIAPTVGSISYVASESVIYVNFSEAMNAADLANAANYGLLIAPDSKVLPDGSTVEIVSPQKVKIKIPATATYPVATNTVSVQVVGSVKDLAGNAIGGLFGTSTNTVTWGTPSAFTVTPAAKQVKLVAKNQLQFELPTELSAIDSSKFTFAATAPDNTVGIASTTYVNNAGKSTVTVTLDKDLTTTDLTNITSLAIADDGLTNAEGLLLSSGPVTFTTVGTHFEDKLAPEITKVETTKVNEITLTFSEDLKAGDVSNFTFSVAGNTVTNADNTSNADKVVLTLGTNMATDATPAVTQNHDIRDVNDNVLVAGTKIVDTVDKLAPVVASVSYEVGATAGTIEGDEVITIAFSEATNEPVLTAADFTITGTGNLAAATFDWNAAGDVLTITLGAAADLVDGDTLAFATASTVTDVAGNQFGTAVFETVDAANNY